MSTQLRPTTTGLSAWLERIVVVDFALFFLFMFDRFAIPLGMPGGVALAALIIFVGMTRRPTVKVPYIVWMAIGYFAILGYLIALSYLNGIAWEQRALRFLLLGLIVLVLAEGRIDRFSAIAGLVTVLPVNAIMYYAGLTSDYYPPFLTGFFADKNVAGLWYAMIGILGLLLFHRPRFQIAWLALAGGLVYLTGSRTSMSAMGVAIVWYLARPYIGPLARIVLGVISARTLVFLEENFARVGVFADRDGTDWFRDQIKEASQIKLSNSPWYGEGLGQGTVDFGPRGTFHFHSSYDMLRIEGGWPFFLIWIGFLTMAVVGIFSTKKIDRDTRAAEASIVCLMVCAWQLGEVFFTSIAFIAMGFALNARYAVERTKKDEFYL